MIDRTVGSITEFKQIMGTPLQLIKQFGGRAGFEKAVHELQSALYDKAA